MPLSGQTALVNYVMNGGKLLFTSWVPYEVSNYRYQIFAPSLLLKDWNNGGYNAGTETLTVATLHPITRGLPSSFNPPYLAFTMGPAQKGTALITGSLSGDAVIVAPVGSGQVVQYAVAPNYAGNPFTDPNMVKLLLNTVNWFVTGN